MYHIFYHDANLMCKQVAQPLGGGRIRHDDGAKAITVYGYSSAYGQAPHDLSVAIIQQWYPLYDPDKITASYEGY